MSQTIACPRCHRQVSVRDNLGGKRLSCPHCKSAFVAPKLDIPEAIPIDDLPKAVPIAEDKPEESGLDFLSGPPSSSPSTRRKAPLRRHKADNPLLSYCSKHPVLTGVGVLMALGMVVTIVNLPKPMPPQQNQGAKPADDGKSVTKTASPEHKKDGNFDNFPQTTGEVVGVWLEDISSDLRGKYAIVREGGKLLLESRYSDGSGNKREVVEQPSPLGRRFNLANKDEENGSDGDYYVIDNHGDLKVCDNNGPCSTARNISGDNTKTIQPANRKDSRPLDSEQQVTGVWLDQTLRSRMTISREDGKLFLTMKYPNVEAKKREVIETADDDGIRIDLKNKEEGDGFGTKREYFIINREGNLEMGDKDGIYGTAKKGEEPIPAATGSSPEDHGKSSVAENSPAVTQPKTKPEQAVAVSPPKLTRSERRGGQAGNPFESVAPSGLCLIGMEIASSDVQFTNHPPATDVIVGIRPIYLSQNGSEKGDWYGSQKGKLWSVVAKKGYAIGGISVKSGFLVDGMSVLFMRLNGTMLDSKDSYESDWIGGRGGEPEMKLGGTGRPVVGIYGSKAELLCSIGLIIDESIDPQKSSPEGKLKSAISHEDVQEQGTKPLAEDTTVYGWSSEDGHKVRASFVQSERDATTKQVTLTLRKEDGHEVRVPFETLDADSRQQAADLISKKRAAERAEAQRRTTGDKKTASKTEAGKKTVSSPTEFTDAVSVFDSDLKEHLLTHKNKMPLIRPECMSVKEAGDLPGFRRVDANNVIGYEYEILQVLEGKQSALIRCKIYEEGRENQIFLVKNLDFSTRVDGKQISLVGPFIVSGTHRYTAVSGASNTIFVVEPYDALNLQKEVQAELVRRGEKPGDDLPWIRVWKVKDHQAVEGRFLEEQKGSVMFQRRDGFQVEVQLSDLNKEDQEWVKGKQKEITERKARIRAWTGSKNRMVRAEFLKQEGSRVILQTEDGNITTFEWRELSPDDQKWIRLHRKPGTKPGE